jgi:hypothetical protein
MFNNMRKVAIFFLFSLVFIQSCKKERIEGPAIRFESDIYNFGEAKLGEVISHTFPFFNPGSDALVLESVRPSCPSCTNIDEYDEKVIPGGKGKIRITYKVAGIPRYADHKVYVETNIPDTTVKVTLTITGNIVAEAKIPAGLEVIPYPLIFGDIDAGDTLLRGTVKLRSLLDEEFLITGVIPPREKSEINVEVVEEGKEYIIDIAIHPSFKSDGNRKEITLKTNLEDSPVIIIPYAYTFNPPESFKQMIKR